MAHKTPPTKLVHLVFQVSIDMPTTEGRPGKKLSYETVAERILDSIEMTIDDLGLPLREVSCNGVDKPLEFEFEG